MGKTLLKFGFHFRAPVILKFLLPIAPVGLRETLDGWPPPVSSAGQIF